MKRRFDGYVATKTSLAIGQVVFLGEHRAVVRERFVDMAAWNSERMKVRKDEGKRDFQPGMIPCQTGPATVAPVQAEPPPAGSGYYYYGVDLIPEEPHG